MYDLAFPGTYVFRAYQAPAPVASLAAPEVSVVSETADGGARSLRLHVASMRGAPTLYLHLPTQGEIAAASVNVKTIDRGMPSASNIRELRLGYYGLPPGGIELEVKVQGLRAAQVTVAIAPTTCVLSPDCR